MGTQRVESSLSPGDEVRLLLERWPERGVVDTQRLPGIYRRFADAVEDVSRGMQRVAPSDLFALTRQLLRHESLVMDRRASIRIPDDPRWPPASAWRQEGFKVLETMGFLSLEADLVFPRWIKGPRGGLELAITAPHGILLREGHERIGSLRRSINPIPSDPFFHAITGQAHYRGGGQREATRAVLTARPGSAVLVSLPTGTGKTAAALVPALVGGPTDLTVIVVPTTALALDQERAVAVYKPLTGSLEAPFAYHSGMDHLLRNTIRERIRAGAQRILITSPEAAVGSLASTLFDAAAAGRLRYFVIDEAHTVAEWGSEFRPEFQQLAGLRRGLLEAAERHAAPSRVFRTVLLSATLPVEAISTLAALFGDRGMEMVAATMLRPEPVFFRAPCDSAAERLSRLREVAAHLPRPMVIYVTRPRDADSVAADLRGAGFRRVSVVTGRTSTAERKDALADWRGNSGPTRSDIVVASSAFGLGVDLSDVRTVVHACIPETVDRFYQEVGRGGRDGHLSVSLLMPAPGDASAARRLSVPTLISRSRARERWHAMQTSAEHVGDGCYRMDLRARPEGISMGSKLNSKWNMRTLALMARAGMVELGYERPPRRRADEDPAAWEARREKAFSDHWHQVLVRPLHFDLSRGDAWETDFRRTRDATTKHFEQSFQETLRIVRGACPAGAFRRTYAVPPMKLPGGRRIRIVPLGRCGGCPEHPLSAALGDEVMPDPAPGEYAVSTAATGLFRDRPTLVATYPRGLSQREWIRQVRELVERAVQHGFQELIGPSFLLDDPIMRKVNRFAPAGFTFFSGAVDAVSGVVRPSIAVLASDPRGVVVPPVYLERPDGAPPLLLVVPDDATDPVRRDQPIQVARAPHWPLPVLLSALQ